MANISEIQRRVIPIARHYGVKRLYLFGSYAKGTANEKSDIDLLVEKGKPMSLLQLSGIHQMIQKALQFSVDLITTTGVGEDFRTEIAGTEILKWARHQNDWITWKCIL